VAGGWRRLHNEELYNLYPSPNIIRMIKSMRMRWATHIARMVEMRNMYQVLLENLKGGGYSGPERKWDVNIRRIFGNGVGKCGLNASDSG
jgi:hypothetical protein